MHRVSALHVLCDWTQRAHEYKLVGNGPCLSEKQFMITRTVVSIVINEANLR